MGLEVGWWKNSHHRAGVYQAELGLAEKLYKASRRREATSSLVSFLAGAIVVLVLGIGIGSLAGWAFGFMLGERDHPVTRLPK